MALIHATTAAIGPAREAFADRFPEAGLWNLLDDLLLVQADAAGEVTEPLARRMLTLIDYALAGGADAVLLTCSMYGPVAGEVTARRPILGSDDALFARVIEVNPARVAVLGPLRAPVADTVARLRAQLDAHHAGHIQVDDGTVIHGAVEAVRAGDPVALQAAVVRAVRTAEAGADLIVLGQFSLSPAAAAAAAAVSVPVLSPPQLAADTLRAYLMGSSAA